MDRESIIGYDYLCYYIWSRINVCFINRSNIFLKTFQSSIQSSYISIKNKLTEVVWNRFEQVDLSVNRFDGRNGRALCVRLSYLQWFPKKIQVAFQKYTCTHYLPSKAGHSRPHHKSVMTGGCGKLVGWSSAFQFETDVRYLASPLTHFVSIYRLWNFNTLISDVSSVQMKVTAGTMRKTC